MMQTFENQQPSLLELIEEVPRIALAPAQKAQLATLVEALLAEIAAIIWGAGPTFTFANRRPTSSCTTMKVAVANMASPIALARSAGPRSRSLTTISDVPVAGSRGLASNA